MVKLDQSGKSQFIVTLGNSLKEMGDVTMDLVTDLPKSNGYMAIAIFVDKLTENGTSCLLYKRDDSHGI